MIRPLAAADVGPAAEIRRAVRVDGIYSEHGVKHMLDSMPGRAQGAAWVADDGGIAGWAFAHRRWWRATDSAYAWVGVLPGRRGRGIGDDLWRACEAHIATLEVRRVFSDELEDAGRRFLERRGFSEDRVDIISAVEPRRVDFGELESRESAARAAGYALASLRDVDPRLVFELDRRTADDMPGGDAPHELRYEEWRAELYEGPELSHDGSFVVVHREEVVANALLSADLDVRRARNEGTATRREHRRRGLATLAKLGAIRWAAEAGIARIVTDNAESNAPMLAINRRLGYAAIAERRHWVKELAAQ